MVAIYDVIFDNIKVSFDYSQRQWSVAFAVLWVDVTEAENIFVPNGNVEMAKICGRIQHGKFTQTVVRIDNWIFFFFGF